MCDDIGEMLETSVRDKDVELQSICVDRIMRLANDGIAENNRSKIQRADRLIGDAIGGMQTVPDGLFRFLLGLLSDPKMHRLEHGWILLRVFDENWDVLSPQRVELRSAIESGLAEFRHWMSCFVLCELLGRRFADERALALFSRLRSSADEEVRHFVPYGLGEIARFSVSEAVRDEARRLIEGMKTDPSAQVRREVGLALYRLQEGSGS